MDKGRNRPSEIAEVTTPCLLVDIDRLKKNATRMLDICQQMNVDLRSHTKTHKTLEAAVIATGESRRKIACSTIPECQMYADGGFDDILLAFPITANKTAKCVELTNRLKEFHVMVSSVDGVQCLKDGASGLADNKVWSVFIEVDPGYGRTGICFDSEELLETAKRVHQDPSMKLQGLYSHCGQAYNAMTPSQRKEDQKRMVDQYMNAAKRLRSQGIEAPVLGTGSTPTCSMPDMVLSSLNEFHPGNYIFNDYEQVLLGSCQEEDIACCVATRVVCQRKDLGLLVVDCGFLAISHDGRQQRPKDYCIIKGHPHLRMIDNSQELGKIQAKEGETINFDNYPVGTMLFIYPYHSCAAANMHEEYLVHTDQKITAVWRPVKGWLE